MQNKVTTIGFAKRLSVIKTHQFHVAISRDQQVLWLKIPVDDTVSVQVLQSFKHTGYSKPGCIVIEVPSTTMPYMHNLQLVCDEAYESNQQG